jgi:hypothetical protein
VVLQENPVMARWAILKFIKKVGLFVAAVFSLDHSLISLFTPCINQQ